MTEEPTRRERLSKLDELVLLGNDAGALRHLRSRARSTRTQARNTIDFIVASLGAWPDASLDWAEARASLENVIAQMTEVEEGCTEALTALEAE